MVVPMVVPMGVRGHGFHWGLTFGFFVLAVRLARHELRFQQSHSWRLQTALAAGESLKTRGPFGGGLGGSSAHPPMTVRMMMMMMTMMMMMMIRVMIVIVMVMVVVVVTTTTM